MRLSVIIPTLGRSEILTRVLARLVEQRTPLGEFEVIVVADAAERDVSGVEAAIAERPYDVRLLRAETVGASAARNRGWRQARAPLLLFLDDDVLPGPELVSEHLDWHERHTENEVGVLGRVRWADGLRVTPFMRWLDHGIQFAYPEITGEEAGWGRFYTANVTVKRALIERVGGFDEENFPFGYEDLDLAYRLNELGFRLLYNRRAEAEHLHAMTLESWRRRVPRIAASERAFVRRHPDVSPHFHELFRSAAEAPRVRGRGARLATVVPRRVPWLGRRVWLSADMWYRQQLAPPFLAAWESAAGDRSAGGGHQSLPEGSDSASSAGSDPAGPK